MPHRLMLWMPALVVASSTNADVVELQVTSQISSIEPWRPSPTLATSGPNSQVFLSLILDTDAPPRATHATQNRYEDSVVSWRILLGENTFEGTTATTLSVRNASSIDQFAFSISETDIATFSGDPAILATFGQITFAWWDDLSATTLDSTSLVGALQIVDVEFFPSESGTLIYDGNRAGADWALGMESTLIPAAPTSTLLALGFFAARRRSRN